MVSLPQLAAALWPQTQRREAEAVVQAGAAASSAGFWRIAMMALTTVTTPMKINNHPPRRTNVRSAESGQTRITIAAAIDTKPNTIGHSRAPERRNPTTIG